MIRIDVEGYCHNCLDFEADVTKPGRNTDNTWSDTVVQCKYRKRCSGIRRYLMTQPVEDETEAVG